MYWAGDKAHMLREVLARITPDRERMKRQVKWLLDTYYTYFACLCTSIKPCLFNWYGSFIANEWPVTKTHTLKISLGLTGSPERYHKQCTEAHGRGAFLSSPWSHSLPSASGKWDRLHEDQRNEKDGWDSIHVLPCVHQDTAYEGKAYCFLTRTWQEKKRKTHAFLHPQQKWNSFPKMSRYNA